MKIFHTINLFILKDFLNQINILLGQRLKLILVIVRINISTKVIKIFKVRTSALKEFAVQWEKRHINKLY